MSVLRISRLLGGARRRARRYARDEQGMSSIEFVIWTPAFMALIALAFDVSVTFHSLGRMWDAARYAARIVANGKVSADTAKTFALSELPGHATFTVDIAETADTVTVTVAGQGVSPAFGFLELFSPGSLNARYVMRKEDF